MLDLQLKSHPTKTLIHLYNFENIGFRHTNLPFVNHNDRNESDSQESPWFNDTKRMCNDISFFKTTIAFFWVQITVVRIHLILTKLGKKSNVYSYNCSVCSNTRRHVLKAIIRTRPDRLSISAIETLVRLSRKYRGYLWRRVFCPVKTTETLTGDTALLTKNR